MPSEISHFHIVHTTVVHLTTAGVSHSVWLLTVFVIICRRHSLYCDHTKSLLGNNSGKSEPIGTTFYRRHMVKVARSPANFWRPPPNGHKMTAKTEFCELCHRNNASFHPLYGGRFPWNLNMKRESVSWKLSEQNFEIFSKGGHFPGKPHFSNFLGYTCDASAPKQSKAKEVLDEGAGRRPTALSKHCTL